jgi:hypothetical protein
LSRSNAGKLLGYITRNGDLDAGMVLAFELVVGVASCLILVWRFLTIAIYGTLRTTT